jgi:BNR repeat-like domain
MASLLATGLAISAGLVYGGPAYDAFPGATVLPNGEVLVSFRTGAAHASSDGRLVLARADRPGGPWRISAVYDDPRIDDRSHLGLTRLSNGDLLLPFYQYEAQDGGTDVRSFLTTSLDRGRTWSKPEPVAKGWVAAYGRILELPKRLLMPAYTRRAAVLLNSDNGGETWHRYSVIGPLSETSVLPIGGQRLLAVGRSRSGSGEQHLYEARSNDGGSTWRPPTPLFPGVSPDLFSLRNGQIVLCLADRLVSQAIQCRWRRRGGHWSSPVTIWTASDVDFGYPTSLERRSGRLVTIFYDRGDVISAAYSSDLSATPGK